MDKQWNRKKIYIRTIILYVGLVVIANCSLLTGNNMMKWDIFDAHYPMATFMGDALRSGQLPLWNPMINYGTPQYAIAGMPVWYPITLLLGVIGYSPFMIGLEYSIHMILAGFGMFLLSFEYIKHKNGQADIVATVVGCFYMFSTVFISNAQHIMIFASATWIPWVLLYLKRYISNRKIINALLSGGFSGLIFLGGYPEIFLGLFLCLIPYTLYECKLEKKSESFKVQIWEATKVFITVCVITVWAALISILPFIHSLLYITRGINVSVQPQPFSINAFLTSIIPGISNKMGFPGDISMVYCYMGLFVIISIIVLIVYRKKQTGIYLGIASFAFMMTLGNSFFLYPLFHKFFPLFSSFRFPSVWRCLIAVFILIAVSLLWIDMDDAMISKKFIGVLKGSAVLLLGIALSVFIINHVVLKRELSLDLDWITMMIATSVLLIVLYIPILIRINERKISSRTGMYLILVVACIEVLSFQFFEFPVTIGTYPHYILNDQQYVDNVYNQFKDRNTEMNFIHADRTNTPLIYTRDIILNKTLDEDGYLSFKLRGVQGYKESVNRYIQTQNPIMFFTNNVVTEEDYTFETWKMKQDVPSVQVHAQRKPSILPEDKRVESGELEELWSEKLEFTRNSNQEYTIYNDNILNTYEKVRKIRVYTDTAHPVTVKISFILENGQLFNESTQAWQMDKVNYFDIYLPTGNENIGQVQLQFDQKIDVNKVEYIEGKRMSNDKYINMESYTLNEIRVNVDAPTEGYVMLQQAYYPGWKAYVNGEHVKIEKLNDAFMGVWLQPGNSKIEFRFMPIDFIIGAIGTGSFIVIIMIYALKKKGKIDVL